MNGEKKTRPIIFKPAYLPHFQNGDDRFYGRKEMGDDGQAERARRDGVRKGRENSRRAVWGMETLVKNRSG